VTRPGLSGKSRAAAPDAPQHPMDATFGVLVRVGGHADLEQAGDDRRQRLVNTAGDEVDDHPSR
jgi:hypothetical protein